MWGVPFVGRQPPRGAPVRRLPGGARRWSCRSWCCWCRAATRCSSRWRTTAATGCSGQTIDDAAGEAFDKVARYLGLGYPGGPGHRPRWPCRATRPPSPSPGRCCDEGLDFSFSGLKTAGRQLRAQAPRRPDRRRGRQLPAGRGRRAGDQGAAGGRARWAPRAWPWRAGWRPTRCCGSSSWTPAPQDDLPGFLPTPGHVHRQRRDDRRGGLAPAAPRRPVAADRRAPTPTSASASPAEPRLALSGRGC